MHSKNHTEFITQSVEGELQKNCTSIYQ